MESRKSLISDKDLKEVKTKKERKKERKKEKRKKKERTVSQVLKLITQPFFSVVLSLLRS